MTRILGVFGSLRRDSHNTNLLRAAAEASDPDVELGLYDGLKEVPPFDEDDEVHARPVSVARLNAAIANADAVLFATPEYNASIPGHLKNAIDWISRPVATLRKVLAALGARVLDVELPVPHAHTRFEEGELTDDEIRTSLAEVVEALAAEMREREDLQVVA